MTTATAEAVVAGGWSGLVAYVIDIDGQPALVQAWLPADRLRPADTSAR